MNIQQLEYIIAVDTYRHFAIAAEKCFVTQPTLSMMIQKLEEELDIKIFDRSKHPVVPTDTGSKIILQARKAVSEVNRIREVVTESKGEIRGELRLGIIPTLAPYLLPLFLGDLIKSYPLLNIRISELTTASILRRLEMQELDAAILAIPVQGKNLKAYPLFYEKFMIYASPHYKPGDERIKIDELEADKLWLLEEGHCLRNQILNFCDLRKNENTSRIGYEAGSIETLKRMVEINDGITIVPELALNAMNNDQLGNIRNFEPPVPGREIGIITNRYFVKEKMIDMLRNSISAKIPDEMKNQNRLRVARVII